MATCNNTKATQTEEDEEDCLHLTAKDMNFKCPEGMTSKVETFEIIPKWGFHIGVKLDGIRYHGVFLKSIDTFGPINCTTRRRLTFSKKNKTRPSVARTKKPNVFSRENFPKGYIDTRNTIEARLRYGRDKKIPAFNSATPPGDTPSQSKGDSALKKSPSNMDSSTSPKSSRKIFLSLTEAFASITDSPISVKSNQKKKSWSDVAGSSSNTDSSISAKSDRKKKSWSIIEESASNTDSSISAKNNRKKKWSVVAGSASNTDSSISSNVFEKTSNENSSPCSISYGENDGEMNAATNDTSFCSTANKMTSNNAERQTKVYFLRSLKAMKGQQRDLKSGLGYMVSTPRTDTDALSMNIDDTLQSVTSNQGSSSRISEPGLIEFSPEINTEKQCRKDYESIGNVSTSSQLSEPDLITFSPEINNETNFKTKIIERPSVIKRTGLNSLFSPLSLSALSNPSSKVSSKTSETVSSQFFPEKLYKTEKFGDIQHIEDGDNVLNTNEKSAKQSTESKL